MLEYITQWVPHYLENDIMRNATSLDAVWTVVCKYYGFKQSETQFMKFSAIKREPNERPERLYQRVRAHLHDNLMKKDGDLKYEGVDVEKDEDMSPTVERLAVLRWMELIDEELPSYVARVFAHDLQKMSLKDLQPQIVDSIDSFLEEIQSKRVDCSRANFTYQSRGRSRASARNSQPARSMSGVRRPQPQSQQSKYQSQPSNYCPVCRAANKPYTTYNSHTMATCDLLSKADKRAMVSAFQVDIGEGANGTQMEDLNEQFDEQCLDDQE